VAIAGLTAHGEKRARHIRQTPNLGLKLTGFYRAHESDSISAEAAAKTAPIQGDLEDLVTRAKNNELDLIYIALPLRCEEKIQALLKELSDTTVTTFILPGSFVTDLRSSRWTEVSGIPVISVFDSPFYGLRASVKRMEDVVLSSLILLLIAIPMAFIAIGVKLDSPGPVFYKQRRVGMNGKVFEILKFRSMPVDTEKAGVVWGNAANKKTTHFGRFIRKTSLDELPQFINVLRGEMSIVGPRPEREEFVQELRKKIPSYMQKHMAKAGITGWAQVNGWRGDTSLDKRIEHDLHYIDHWSVLLDLKIILQTVFRGFAGRNAY